MAKKFKDLTEQEILALAITSEEEDSRIYGDIAEGLSKDSPATSAVFREMQAEESEHRRGLFELYRKRFGEHIPLIRRQDVKGFVHRRPIWLIRPLGLEIRPPGWLNPWKSRPLAFTTAPPRESPTLPHVNC